MQKGFPYYIRAGFWHGRGNTYFRIGLAFAILKVVFPDLGFSKIGFSIRGTFSIREKGVVKEYVYKVLRKPFAEALTKDPYRWSCARSLGIKSLEGTHGSCASSLTGMSFTRFLEESQQRITRSNSSRQSII